MSEPHTRCGYVGLLGRPNTGKSTTLNRLLARKLSIITPKPQTTRHTVLGIKTVGDTQMVFIDTPGLHLDARRAMNRYMNRAAGGVLGYVDVVVFLVQALRWTAEDEAVLRRLAGFSGPVMLAVNKVDRVSDKRRLLPYLDELAGRGCFTEVIPVSALKGTNMDALEGAIARAMPASEFFYPPEQLTTASERFLAAEIIREKLTLALQRELPYALTVEIERYEEAGRLLRIGAVIWVERAGQKAIVIGQGGAGLKTVGRQARAELEAMSGRKVHLETWVKVREGWSDDERALRSLGYDQDA